MRHAVSIERLEPGTHQQGQPELFYSSCTCGVNGTLRVQPLTAAVDAAGHLAASSVNDRGVGERETVSEKGDEPERLHG